MAPAHQSSVCPMRPAATHTQIWYLYEGATECPFCRTPLPSAIEVASDDVEESHDSQIFDAPPRQRGNIVNLKPPRRHEPQRISNVQRQPERISNVQRQPQQSQMIPAAPLVPHRERTGNFKRNITSRLNVAHQQTRRKKEPPPEISPYDKHYVRILLEPMIEPQASLVPRTWTKQALGRSLSPVQLNPLNLYSGWPIMTEEEWVEKYVIPNCFDHTINAAIPPGTPCSLGTKRDGKTLVKIGQWEEEQPRNIEDLFGESNIYKWTIKDGMLVVKVSFYVASDDEPATPKSGRSGKRKRRVSVQSEEELVQSERGEESVLGDDLAEGDDAAQSEGGDDLAVEDDAAQLEGGDDSAVEDDAAQLEGGDDLALEDDASQSGDHTTPSYRRRRLPMPHKLSTVHPDNVDPLPEFNTRPVVKSEPGEGNARRSQPAVQRRSKRFK